MARRARLSSVFINLIEQGKRPKPSSETLEARARAFNLEPGTMYAAVRSGQAAPSGSLDDPRLTDWPPDMIARLRDLYLDMRAEELDTALALGVESMRRLKQRGQRSQRQISKGPDRPGAPNQEGGPAEQGEPPGSGRISATARRFGRLEV